MTEVVVALEVFTQPQAARTMSFGGQAATSFAAADESSFPRPPSQGGLVTVAKRQVKPITEETFSQRAAAAD